jgi:hypothetical protein
MNRRKAVAVLSLASVAAAGTKRSAIHDRFVGVWKLVSSESKDKIRGKVQYPYGTKPVGRITYDAAGRMSAQLMHPGRRRVGGSPTRGSAAFFRDASTDDMREILTGFSSYFGTFDIDESSRTVIHHVQAHLVPGWVGTDIRRSYEFSGNDRLILTALFDQSVNRLVWERDL